MIVKMGFNTDFGRDKFDVGLDETDLARILAEEGIPPDVQLTAAEAFTILVAEAERFSETVRARITKDDSASDRASQASVQLHERLAKVKARLGVD